jgi:ankyrin repeat protein
MFYLTFLSRFLLARLHLDSLTDKMSIKDVKLALKRLPKGGDALETAYGNAMERIDAQQPGFRGLAKQVLSWITYAKRPLTLLELQHALAVELEEPRLDPENLKDVGDMVSVCAGLVTVEQESGNIRLVHYTTQEYLERIHFRSDPDIQAGIAATCLTYLSFDAFQCGYCVTDEMFENLLSQYPLLDYAAKHWGHYVYRDTEEPEEIKHLALKFLENENKASISAQVSLAPAYRSQYNSQTVPRVYGIHLCAFFGLKSLMMALLSGTTPADLLTSDRRTSLSWAAERGHKAVVELLLDRDNVVVDSRDDDGITPLSWAARSGHETVVKLLLDRDDVVADRQDNLGRTPLLWAAERGHETVVKLLLDRDDVVADRQDDNTPPLWAAGSGHEAAVKLLLDRDDVVADRQDTFGRTSLSLAAVLGHKAIVKLLLDRDDVVADRQDNFGRTPLSWAVEGGHKAIVKLLLDRDDVVADRQDNFGRTPLSFAALSGHEAIVKLLRAKSAVRS